MRQAFCIVCLIFLFAAILLAGLAACERGLREVNGLTCPPGAFVLAKAGDGMWTVTLAGVRVTINTRSLSRLIGTAGNLRRR